MKEDSPVNLHVPADKLQGCWAQPTFKGSAEVDNVGEVDGATEADATDGTAVGDAGDGIAVGSGVARAIVDGGEAFAGT